MPRTETSERLPLDALVTRMRDPTFAGRHRRALSLRQTSAHVNPVMLAVCSRDSLYLREWRQHARRCAACARVFNHFGIPVDTE
jgi:hypothetical protein